MYVFPEGNRTRFAAARLDFLPALKDGDSYCGPSCGDLASVGSCFIPDSARERASYTGSTGV